MHGYSNTTQLAVLLSPNATSDTVSDFIQVSNGSEAINLLENNLSGEFPLFVEDEPLPKFSLVESVFICLVLCLIIIVSAAGNILVVVAVTSDRNLRKTSNYFIASLAVADTLVALVVMTFAVVNDILGYWIFGSTFCHIWISSDVMCSTASILNLCAISLDRYIHIRNPLHYEQWVTARRTLLGIAGVWILSALISFLPIHLGWHKTGDHLTIPPTPSATPESTSVIISLLLMTSELPNITNTTTAQSQTNLLDAVVDDDRFYCMLDLNSHYAILSSMVSFYVPCIVMILIYFRLYQYARRQVRSIRRTWTSTTVKGNGSAGVSPSHHRVNDHKAAITLGVIMGTFLFCWTPFFTINIIDTFVPVLPVIFSIFTWLGYFNSTLNPIIYSIFNKEFRDAFKRVLLRMKCEGKCPQMPQSKPKHYNPNNKSSVVAEYGSLTARNKSSSGLLSERITCV